MKTTKDLIYGGSHYALISIAVVMLLYSPGASSQKVQASTIGYTGGVYQSHGFQ